MPEQSQAKRKKTTTNSSKSSQPPVFYPIFGVVFSMQRVSLSTEPTWPGQCICPPLASTPSLDLETVLAAPGKAQEIIPVWWEKMGHFLYSWIFCDFLDPFFLAFLCLFKKESDMFLMAKTMGTFQHERQVPSCRQSLQAQKEPLPPVDPKVGREKMMDVDVTRNRNLP